MLKKIIIGVLVAIVVVAAGVSIYNASAAPQVEAQVEAPAAAPDTQAQVPPVENRTASGDPAVPAVSQPDDAQTTMSQNRGARGGAGGAGNGGRRGAGQGTQAGSANAAATGESTCGTTTGSQEQGTGTASGRPAWAGQGQGRQH